MADEGIRVTVNPAGGRRLAESPSSSFAADKYTGGGQRYAAPGVGPRDQIAVEQKLLAVEQKLAGAVEQLGKKFERATGATASERTAFESRIDRLSQSMKREAEPEGASGSKSAIDRERAAQARTGPAAMPGSASRGGALASGMTGAAGSLINAGGAAWSGDVTGTLGHLAEASMLRRGASWAWGGAKSLLGFGAEAGEAGEAGEAVAGGVAAEGAEAAGAGVLGSVGLPALAIAGTAAAGYGAYSYLKGGSGAPGGALGGLVRGAVDTALDVPQDLLTLAAARRYGSEEEPRQALAYRAAREFGESGAGMIAATTGSRWSSLGIDPATATQTVSTMREIGGSRYISNAQAFKGAQLGTYLGFSPEQSAQVGGAAGRLGVSPEEAIRVIAQGVERGNQQGRQFEVASASLDYLKQIATSAAVSGTTGLTAISNLSAILAKSGIAAFQGAGGVSAIGGIEAAHRGDDFFGIKSMGAAFAQFGEAEMLRGAHGDIAKAEEIRQGGFSGRYSKIYAKSIHREIGMARGLGPLGMEALEEEWGMPIGSYLDPRTGKNVSVNSALDDLDQAIQSGDYLKASRIQSDLLSSGAKNISPMEAASATHALGRAATGEATARSYAAGERLEAAGLSLLRRNINDRSTTSALDYLSTTLGPSKPSALDSVTAATSAIAGYGLGGVLGAGTLGSGAAAAGSVAGYGLGDVLSGRLGGAPAAASSVAGYALGDSISGAVILLAGILERILAAIERGGGAPASAPAAPASLAPAHDHGPIGPTASTPKSSRH